MPTDTFNNLETSKKEKVYNAMVNQFISCPLESVSIKNIVIGAGIPRGSFYQYFIDKEEALRYIIEQTGKENEEIIDADDIYDLILCILKKEIRSLNRDKESTRVALILQISKSPRATSIFNEEIVEKNIQHPNVKQLIKNAHLDYLTTEQTKAIMELLIASLKDAILLSLEQPELQSEIEEKLRLKITLIRTGIEELLLKS